MMGGVKGKIISIFKSNTTNPARINNVQSVQRLKGIRKTENADMTIKDINLFKIKKRKRSNR